MTTYVLVPGFWLGAWAWDGVARRLRAGGHEVHAVTLTGVAERAHLGGEDTDAEAHVRDIVAVLTANDLTDVVLVGHSGAGPLVAAAAERVPERLALLVYVDTGPLPSGMAQIEFYEPDGRRWVHEQIAGHGGRYPLPSFDKLVELGASVDGLDDAARDRMRRLATPHPGRAVTGAVARGAPTPGLSKLQVACSIPAEQIRQLVAAGVPAFVEMGDDEWTIAELPTGHWPMLSRPDDLAALLDTHAR